MNKTVSCILFLAVCMSLVGTVFGGIFIDNAEFDDVSVAEGGWTDVIEPWVCDNITGGDDAWISNGFDPNEPEPITPALYTMGNIVYQVLSATYEDGAAYIFSVDVAIWDYTDDWKIFLYDATTGDHLSPLVCCSSTDVGQEPIPVLCQWYRKSVMFVTTASEAGHQIGVGVAGGYRTMFDNAELEPPVKAWGPDPYDGEINVFVDRILSWHTAKDPNDPAIINPIITGHKLYMRTGGSPTDPNMDFVTLIPVTGETAEYIPVTDFERDTTYYWRVDEVSGANTISGDIWLFQTVSTAPVIDEMTPADMFVDAGADAVFTVSAYNPFTGSSEDLSFQWYKAGEPDEMLGEGEEYSGVETATLTVLDVQLADNDEGQYYCVVTNTVGSTDSSTSRLATLIIKKMIGWWKFDETEGSVAADSTLEGGDNSGTVQTLKPNPNEVWNSEGIVGGALDCDGWSTWVDTHKYAADLGIDGNKPRSVSAWVYTKGFNNGGVFDVGRRVTSQDFGLRTLGAVNQWRIQYWGLDRDFVYPSKNTWVHFVHTHGPEGTKVYADGQLIVDWPGKVLNTGDDFTFRMGQYGPNNEKFFGLIDDVRLYNYALDQLEAINLYLEVKPDETVCLSYPALDFTGPEDKPDCVVGLSDFALMASEWMQCNIVPDCVQ